MSKPRIQLPLHTQRLILREFGEADWEAMHAYASREDVCRFMPWGPNDERAQRVHVERAMAARNVRSMIWL